MSAGHSVNPLKLQGSVTLEDLDPLFSSSLIHNVNPPSNYYRNRTRNHIRERRDTEKVVNTRTIIDKDGHRHQAVSMVRKIKDLFCALVVSLFFFTLHFRNLFLFDRTAKPALPSALTSSALYTTCKRNRKQR